MVWSGNVSKPERSQLVPPVERGEMNVKHIFLYIPIPHGLRESARVWALEASVRGSYARFIDFSIQFVHVSRYNHILGQFGVKIRCAAASSRGTFTTACIDYNSPGRPTVGYVGKF